MKYEFNKVLGGLSRWIGDNLYHRMNDVQEVLARVVIGRVLSDEEDIKAGLVKNGIVRRSEESRVRKECSDPSRTSEPVGI
jgi:hypothetical protein